MTKALIQRRLWRNFIQRGLVVPIFIHSRSLLFEGNASLKCVYSGLTPLGVLLLQGAHSRQLGGSHFIHIIRDFPCFYLPFLYVIGCGFQLYTKGLISSCV